MIADLKPYPAMKGSGVAWLGKVPGHWTIRALKRLCSRSALYGANIPAAEYVPTGVRFLRTTDITDDGAVRRGGVFVTEIAAHDYMLSDGDLLLSRSGTIGRSLRYRSNVHGPCSYAGYLVRFVPGHIASPDYLFYFTKSSAFADFIRVTAISSTIENVNGDKYANMPLPVPPPEEQAAIVRFLDHADRNIRRAIRAKQKLVKLLEEEKRAIIHRAVTRGLDPNVRLKPSGIEWLGDVPENWLVVKLGRYFRCSSGTTPARGVSGFYGGKIPWVKTGELLDAGINTANEHITKAAMDASSLSLLPIDTVLVAMYGQGKTRGRTGLLKIEATVNQACLAILPNLRRAAPEYFQLMLIAQYARLRFTSDARNATQPNLNAELVKGLKIALPPIAEQMQILGDVSIRVKSVNTGADRARQQILLLREYRTRLIADVVTGKLDVRDAAARLPDEAPEMEAEDDIEAVGEGDETVEPEGDDDAEAEAEHEFKPTTASRAANA